MKIKLIICSLATTLLFIAPASAASTSNTTNEGGKLKRHDAEHVSLSGVVEAIDQASRSVTVRGAKGKRVDFIVSEDVKRLNEIKVGDTVRAEYIASMVAELREPTAEEKAKPVSLVVADNRAPSGSTPAGAIGAQVRAVTTVEVLDRLNQTVTVKGPAGGTKTVDVKDPARLMQLRLGDTIVLTYTEAVALAVEKVASAPTAAKK